MDVDAFTSKRRLLPRALLHREITGRSQWTYTATRLVGFRLVSRRVQKVRLVCEKDATIYIAYGDCTPIGQLIKFWGWCEGDMLPVAMFDRARVRMVVDVPSSWPPVSDGDILLVYA
jgi:hypothetical protein